MLHLIKAFTLRSWRYYLSSFTALIIATIFIFLQVTAPTFLNASLQTSVAKTSAGVDAIAVESALPLYETITKIAALPGVKNASANCTVPLQAIKGPHASSVSAFSLTPNYFHALVVSPGRIPQKANEILISAAAAQSLKTKVGDEITLVYDQSNVIKTSTVKITGIAQRSPFVKSPSRFEIFTPDLSALQPPGSSPQAVDANHFIEIQGEDALDLETLITEISTITQHPLIPQSQLSELEYADQKEAIDYLIISINWVLNVPVLLCFFLILMNLRNMIIKRKPLGKLLESIGSRPHLLILLITGELLLFTAVATALGIALGRAISVITISYLKTTPASAFIVNFPQVHIAEYLCTIIFTYALLAIAIMISTPLIMAFSRESRMPKISDINVYNTENIQAQKIKKPESTASEQAKSTRKNLLPAMRKISIKLSGLEVLFFCFVISFGTYYLAIITENLLQVAGIGANIENLTHLTNITLVVITGLLIAFGIQKFLISIFPIILHRFFKKPRHYLKLNYFHTKEVQLSAIFIFGITTAMVTLSTTAHINDFQAEINNEKSAPYDVMFTQDTAASAFSHQISEANILQLFRQQPNIAKVAQIHTFNAHLLADGKQLINDVPLSVADQDLLTFVQDANPSANIEVPQGTIVLPNSYNWIAPQKSPLVHIEIPDTPLRKTKLDFQLEFADVKKPLIAPADAHKILQNLALGEKTEKVANLQSRQTSDILQSFYWIRLTPEGKANFAESYKDLLDLQTKLPSMRIAIATQTAMPIVHNHIATRLTTLLLSFTLVFALLNLATKFVTAIKSSRYQLRLFTSLGISRQRLIKSAIVNSLGLIALTSFSGIGVGFISGTIIANNFLTATTESFFPLLPWSYAAILALISIMIVGLTMRIHLETTRQLSE